MSSRPDQNAEPKFVVTNTLIVRDVQRSVAFNRVLGATYCVGVSRHFCDSATSG
jgi:hypothetical protein